MTYEAYAKWLDSTNPAIRANAIICLIHQANYLLDRQIQTLEIAFIKDGGYSEQLATARIAEHNRQKQKAGPQAGANENGVPPCPLCGNAIVRTARQGKEAGKQFFGCTAYPDCKGLLSL